MGFVEAEREQVRAQIAIMGPSGSGKTVGALKLAYGMTGDWKKIGVVDTEHDRSKVYVGTKHTGGTNIGKFMHMKLEPPYTHIKFSTALDDAVKAGLDVVIFDSFSHEWDGVGGIIDWKNDLGEGFNYWKEPKKAHNNLIDKIMHAPINVIVTIRTKQEYVVVPGGGNNGKSSVEKLGLKPVQSGDIDYEFLLSFTVGMDNIAEATKDNTGLFKGLNVMLNEDHGKMLREWVAEGKEVESIEEQEAIKERTRQALIAQFTEARQKTKKAQSWYTNQEIKLGMDIPNWPLSVLEDLDKKLKESAAKAAAKKQAPATPKEEPKVEEAPAPEEPKEEPAPAPEEPQDTSDKDTEVISKILKYIAYDPSVDKVAKEFMEKMKIKSIKSCTDEQLTFLYNLTRRKALTIKKEREEQTV